MSLTMKMFMGIWLKDPGDLTFCHGCMCIPGLHIILKIVFHIKRSCPVFLLPAIYYPISNIVNFEIISMRATMLDG